MKGEQQTREDLPIMSGPLNGRHPRDVHPRRCQAKRSDGVTPCRRYAAKGQYVCRKHGGASPQALTNAKQRLELAADRMAQRLLGIAESEDVPAYVALAAVNSALDRAGITANNQVEVELTARPFERVFEGIQRAGRESASAATQPALDTAQPDIVDAEVVDSPRAPRLSFADPQPPRASDVLTAEEAMKFPATQRRAAQAAAPADRKVARRRARGG